MAAENYLVEMRRLVKADNAILAGYRTNERDQLVELTLFWSFSDKKRARKCATYLRRSTSTLNDTSPRQWVDNPIASSETYEGRFRQVSVTLGKHNDAPGILQVLRLGFLQALPASEAQEDEARLVSFARDPITGMRRLTRKWDTIDPDYLQRILATRASTTQIVNPRVDIWDREDDQHKDHKFYTGTFAVAERVSGPVEGDCVDILQESLQEVSSISTLAGLTALTPEVIVQENQVRELFSSSTGNSWNTIALRYRHIAKASRAYLMGEAPGNLQTVVSTGDVSAWATTTAYALGHKVRNSGTLYLCVTAHTSGTFSTDLAAVKWIALTAWSYVDRRFEEQVDNTGTFTLLLRVEEKNPVTTLALLTAMTPEIITQAHVVKSIFTTVTGDLDSLVLSYKGLTEASRAYCLNECAVSLQGLITSGDAPAWVTATAYLAGQIVLQTTTRYVCLVAHTAHASFTYDLTMGKWLALSGWTYSDRNFAEQADSTAIFSILFSRVKWSNGTAAADALITAQQNSTDTRYKKTLERTWLRRTKPAVDVLTHTSTAWATGTVYAVGDVVTQTGNTYACVTAHTSGTFATDLAAAKWVLTSAAWAKGVSYTPGTAVVKNAAAAWSATTYAIDDMVTESGNTYLCLVAHTGGVFATDLAAGKWILTSSTGDGSAYICLKAHTASTFPSDLAALYWVTSTEAGQAKAAYTYQSVAYSHLRWDLVDNGDGSYNVNQTLIVPSSSVKVHDFDTGSKVVDAHEDVLSLGSASAGAFGLVLVETMEKQFGTASGAYGYAQQSTPVWVWPRDHGAPVKQGMGRVKYIGDGFWIAHCVYVTTITSTAWGSPHADPS